MGEAIAPHENQLSILLETYGLECDQPEKTTVRYKDLWQEYTLEKGKSVSEERTSPWRLGRR